MRADASGGSCPHRQDAIGGTPVDRSIVFRIASGVRRSSSPHGRGGSPYGRPSTGARSISRGPESRPPSPVGNETRKPSDTATQRRPQVDQESRLTPDSKGATTRRENRPEGGNYTRLRFSFIKRFRSSPDPVARCFRRASRNSYSVHHRVETWSEYHLRPFTNTIPYPKTPPFSTNTLTLSYSASSLLTVETEGTDRPTWTDAGPTRDPAADGPLPVGGSEAPGSPHPRACARNRTAVAGRSPYQSRARFRARIGHPAVRSGSGTLADEGRSKKGTSSIRLYSTRGTDKRGHIR